MKTYYLRLLPKFVDIIIANANKTSKTGLPVLANAGSNSNAAQTTNNTAPAQTTNNTTPAPAPAPAPAATQNSVSVSEAEVIYNGKKLSYG